MFARRASAVTLSKKSSISTNRKSAVRFPMSLRWSSNFCICRTLAHLWSLYPQRVAQKCKVSKIWKISCDNFLILTVNISANFLGHPVYQKVRLTICVQNIHHSHEHMHSNYGLSSWLCNLPDMQFAVSHFLTHAQWRNRVKFVNLIP